MNKTEGKIDTKTMALSAFFAILTGIGSHIQIPIPMVPVTLQTSLVLATGILLGARGGALAMLFYMLLGLLGLPLFTGGGGVQSVLSPSFGFIVGFIPAGWAAGRVSGMFIRSAIARIAIACLVGELFIYGFGLVGLYLNLNYLAGKPVTLSQTVAIGFFPFILPELFKISATIAFCAAMEKRLKFLIHPKGRYL